jgi:hypothetical protein
MTAPRFKFGAIEADGENIVINVTVTIAGLFQKPMQVRVTEDGAQKLIAQVQTAIAKLNRMRLGPGT